MLYGESGFKPGSSGAADTNTLWCRTSAGSEGGAKHGAPGNGLAGVGYFAAPIGTAGGGKPPRGQDHDRDGSRRPGLDPHGYSKRLTGSPPARANSARTLPKRSDDVSSRCEPRASLSPKAARSLGKAVPGVPRWTSNGTLDPAPTRRETGASTRRTSALPCPLQKRGVDGHVGPLA